jgi:predicted RNA-binding protein with PIN domain
MPATDLLIDGYNLLHAAGLGRSRYGRGDLQRARQALLRRLFQLLTPAEIVRTAVVFDARQPPPHLPAHWLIHGMRVVYARPHGDADLLLEELINGHSAPKQLTVVSSDHRLHRAAKSRRASAVDSDEFLEFLERRNPQSPVEIPPPKKTTAQTDITSAELAYWMSVFGDVKVSDLADTRRSVAQNDRPTSGSAGPKYPAKSATRPSSKNRPRPTVPIDPAPIDSASLKAAPELFSVEWINELQRWVDEQQ